MDDQSIQLVDDFLTSEYHPDGPGAAVSIVMNDNIVYERCIGLANLGKEEKITSTSNFRLASLTKQFTAYGILLLEQQGKLFRNDSIGRFFSEEFRRQCPSISQQITIQHLLDHSSGLSDYEEKNIIDHEQWSDYDVLNQIDDQTLFPPGSEYRYSNTGYILLGLILENVSSKSLGEFFHQTIFQPFRMKTSVLYNSEQTAIPNRAFGYVKRMERGNVELADQSATSATRGDGGIYMSLNDYLQWYRHCPPLLLTPVFPIKGTTFASSYFYHFGWFLSDSTGQIRLHTGNSCGFTHQVFRIDDEERKVLVLYLTNLGNHNETIQRFNRLLVEKIPQLNPLNTPLLWEMEGLTR